MINFSEGELPDDGYGNTFILTGTSEHLTMKTPQPPGAPSNLGVVATTCHSMQIAWDPPHETGVDIIGECFNKIYIHSLMMFRYDIGIYI